MHAGQSWTLKRLGPGDARLAERLMTLFGEAFDDPATYTGSRPGTKHVESLLRRDGVFALVALEADAVIGGLVAYDLPKFERERSEIYIYDLAVDSLHRRRGVATALISELGRIARDRGAWVMFVQADPGDDAAIALYTRLGTREDVLHFDISPAGEDASRRS